MMEKSFKHIFKHFFLPVLVFAAVFSFFSISLFSFSTVKIASAEDYKFQFDLKIGSKGAAVEYLQTLLMEKGFDIPSISSGASLPGYFGLQTKAAVQKYQAKNGIPTTGTVGPLTRAKLNGAPTTSSITPSASSTPAVNSVNAALPPIQQSAPADTTSNTLYSPSLYPTSISNGPPDGPPAPCPEGNYCTTTPPTTPQPAGCPAGYTCIPNNLNSAY